MKRQLRSIRGPVVRRPPQAHRDAAEPDEQLVTADTARPRLSAGGSLSGHPAPVRFGRSKPATGHPVAGVIALPSAPTYGNHADVTGVRIVGVNESSRRRMLGFLIACVAAIAAACGGSSKSGQATGSASGHVAPLPNTSLTPQGWSPVSLGAIQISVPSDWFVEDPGFVCGGDVQGMVFVNLTPKLSPIAGCIAPNVIEMGTASSRALTLATFHQTVINSIQVSEGTIGSGSSATRVVRALGIEIQAQGPLATQILATITHSPLSVVLRSSVNSVPADWRRVAFGGLRFSVPRSWTIREWTSWGGCPGNIESSVLVLSTAQTFSAPGCSGGPQTAGYLQGASGMVVGSGPVIQPAPSDANCITRNTLRICIDPPPPPIGGIVPGHELSLLTAQVSVPAQRTVDQIEIGLTGTGIQPLQIFDSINRSA